jgi:hypothetical protein
VRIFRVVDAHLYPGTMGARRVAAINTRYIEHFGVDASRHAA